MDYKEAHMKYTRALALLILTMTVSVALPTTASATQLTAQAGTYTGEISASSSNWRMDGSFVTVECGSTHLSGSVKSHGTGVSVGISPTFFDPSFCNYSTTVLNTGTLTINSSNNVSSSNTTIRITTSVGTCEFSTLSTTLGTLTESNETEGSAFLDISSKNLFRTGGNFLCGQSATLTGNYWFTWPEWLNVD
jgi:hypothetical protein